MDTKIFVNLPVSDLAKSIRFYQGLGFSIDPRFTDETAACVVVSDDIYAMILTKPKFKSFTPKKIADSSRTTEAIIALTVESRKMVDEMAEKALDAGGTESRDPEDHGWMYGRSFEDIDGHIWEFFWMDPDKAK